MIARHESAQDKTDIWSKLAAPLPAGVIAWRQDGKPVQRDGKYVARFVCYIEANTVRERLDSVVPGEWDLTLDLLPTMGADTNDDGEPVVSFKARLQILGVIREDVGQGRDYKAAATDAFKRAGVRFGIAHELYSYEQNWVQVDGDGRYAKPLEDPGTVYARRQARAEARDRLKAENGAVGNGNGNGAHTHTQERLAHHEAAAANQSDEAPTVETTSNGPAGPLALDEPSCPKCGGRMWDNRLSKRNPKAPDFKCRNRSCDGVVWPAKGGYQKNEPAPLVPSAAPNGDEPPPPSDADFPAALEDKDDDLPF
jgi:hypothetical protein